MVYAATAWHWLDPRSGTRRRGSAVAACGYLALWGAGHVIPYDGDPFFEEIQDVYDEIGESLPPDSVLPRPQELVDDRAEIEASGLFDVVDVTQYDWETIYDADGYIELLNTFSGHIAMQDWQRDRLYGEVRRRLAERADGCLRRHWGTILHIARRRPPVAAHAEGAQWRERSVLAEVPQRGGEHPAGGGGERGEELVLVAADLALHGVHDPSPRPGDGQMFARRSAPGCRVSSPACSRRSRSPTMRFLL